jgi:hypothetical protein
MGERTARRLAMKSKRTALVAALACLGIPVPSFASAANFEISERVWMEE